MSTTERNKALIREFFRALNAGDTAAIVAAYADDGEVWTMGRTLISGRFGKAQVSASAGAIFEAFPAGLRFEILDLVAEGEKVAVEARSRGMHVSGREYTNEYHFLFEFRDGRIVRVKEYMDTERVTDVLCGGQRPPPGARDPFATGSP